MIDEDYVGVCKQIVQSCANGTDSVKIPAAFVEKYRWGQFVVCVNGDEDKAHGRGDVTKFQK